MLRLTSAMNNKCCKGIVHLIVDSYHVVILEIHKAFQMNEFLQILSVKGAVSTA